MGDIKKYVSRETIADMLSAGTCANPGLSSGKLSNISGNTPALNTLFL
jgi:hypothetical protein